MNDKLQEQLAVLADKFGTTVEHLWQVMVAQTKIVAIEKAITLLVIVAALYIGYRFLMKATRPDEDPLAGQAVYFILASMLIGFGIHTIYVGITALFNPEYWALMEILNR